MFDFPVVFSEMDIGLNQMLLDIVDFDEKFGVFLHEMPHSDESVNDFDACLNCGFAFKY